MGLADDLAAIPQQAEAVKPHEKPRWEPTVTLTDIDGEATTWPTTDASPDETTLLEGWHLDPAEWQIIPGTLLVNRWQQKPGTDWMYQFKARVIRRGENPRADVDELVKAIARHKPRKTLPEGDHALVVNPADWQAGKAEGGGTPAFVERMQANLDALEDRVRALRKRYAVGEIVIAGMGDLAERCSGNYPAQQFTTDLDERQQQRVVRRLLLETVTRMAKQAARVTVTAVGGNHGETRQGGKAITGPGDNADVAVFEAVYEAISLNPDTYGHVRFHLPDDKLVVALEVAGVRCAWSHGHLARSGASPAAKQVNWWQQQAFGDDPAGARYTGLVDAQVLVTAHYHHFAALETHGRLWLQCPSMDGGSRWFTDSTGQHSATGTLTFLCGPRGVREIEVVA